MALLFGSLYPNLMPSTIDAACNLTIDNASSSPYTLKVMTWAAVFVDAGGASVYQALDVLGVPSADLDRADPAVDRSAR